MRCSSVFDVVGGMDGWTDRLADQPAFTIHHVLICYPLTQIRVDNTMLQMYLRWMDEHTFRDARIYLKGAA